MRTLQIIRKDLHLSAGKLAAMVGHCCEAYWTNQIRDGLVGEVYDGTGSGQHLMSPKDKYRVVLDIDKDIMDRYINGIFTKTICEARNKNHLLKAIEIAESLGLEQDKDFFLIADCCKTELEPEYIDEYGVGRTLVGIGFRPLPNDIARTISKKYQLYRG
jgi:PTH2 family peptidyl-tRNA hydrolase